MSTSRSRRRHAVFLGLALVIAACGSEDARAGDRLRIVTTVAPITSIVASIGGDHVDIRGMVPEGVDSHTFQPTPSQAAALSRADVLFYNGLDLEEPVRQLAEANLPDGAPMVALAEEAIPPEQHIYDFSFPEEGGRPNPHLWTNPPMGGIYGRIVRDTLSRLDPDNAGAYAANYNRFAHRVDALDRAVADATATVPADQRTLLTYHDAYPYFAAEYGWEVVGAIEPASFGEVTTAEVARLARQIETLDVPALFGSKVFPSPILEQLAAQTGAEYRDDLRDDDLPGRPGDPEHSWLALLQHNVTVMVDSLGGDAGPLRQLDTTVPVPDTAGYPQASP